MEGQRSHSKLTRTQSSLLRSSPTFRSSIQSLSSINEYDHSVSSDDDDEEKKKQKMKSNQPGPAGSFRFIPVLTLASISFISYFIYNNVKDEIVTSENLLLALIFLAITLFFANKKMRLIIQTVTVLTNRYRFRFVTKSNCNCTMKPIRWFIDDFISSGTKQIQKREKLIKNDLSGGVEVYCTGDFYEGEFHKGKANGSGVYNFYANGRYEGEWIDGKYDGFGIESWSKGSRYRGQYRKGMRHGFGIYKFYTGDSYAGEWFNGQSHGVGVQTCSDGSCYVGEFKCGVKHGLGCYHFRNDDKYAGEYFGDKVHGFGVYHFVNGQCYEGSWHEGRKQGYGMYTFRSGDTKYGEWDCNTLKIHLPSLTELVLRAVQAARKAGENAINLRSVDEHVNKAVMAANRAATAARVAAVKAVQNEFCDEV